MFLFVVALLLLLPLTLFAIVPLGVILTSFKTLLALPGQMLAIAFDKRRRRNHALENATVNVLEQQYGRRLPLGGFAEADGFHIHGPAQPNVVLAAAEEGLARLKRGETQLALHPRGGTMIVSGELISALTFFVTLLVFRSFAFPALLLAMVLAILAARTLAQPLGLFLQRTLTTSLDVQTLHIDHVDARMPETPFALVLSGGYPTQFRVWTQNVEIAEPVGPRRYKAY
jgi:hypothetical protein